MNKDIEICVKGLKADEVVCFDVGTLVPALLAGYGARVIAPFVLHSVLFLVALYGVFTVEQRGPLWAGVLIGFAVLSIFNLGACQGVMFKVERLSTRLGKALTWWELRKEDAVCSAWREEHMPCHLRGGFPLLSRYQALEAHAAGVVRQVLSNTFYGIARAVLLRRVLSVVLVVAAISAPVTLIYHNAITWDGLLLLMLMVGCNAAMLGYGCPGVAGALSKVVGWPFRWRTARGRQSLAGVSMSIASPGKGLVLSFDAGELPSYSPRYLPEYNPPGKSALHSPLRGNVHVFDVYR